MAFADADFRIHPETFNYIDAVMADPGYIGGATGLTMERWSLGIAVTWYLIMPPLWFFSMDGGVWFCRRSDFLEAKGFDESRPMGEDVAFLSRLKRLGASRRPKQWLATRFTARKLGIAPAMVLNSSRKFDKHGDWHMFLFVFRGAYYLLFARHKIREYADRYWYEERPTMARENQVDDESGRTATTTPRRPLGADVYAFAARLCRCGPIPFAAQQIAPLLCFG